MFIKMTKMVSNIIIIYTRNRSFWLIKIQPGYITQTRARAHIQKHLSYGKFKKQKRNLLLALYKDLATSTLLRNLSRLSIGWFWRNFIISEKNLKWSPLLSSSYSSKQNELAWGLLRKKRKIDAHLSPLKMVYFSIMSIAIVISIACVTIFITHQHHWSSLFISHNDQYWKVQMLLINSKVMMTKKLQPRLQKKAKVFLLYYSLSQW